MKSENKCKYMWIETDGNMKETDTNSVATAKDGDYVITYKAVDKANSDERHWNACGPSEAAARAMIA